MPDGGGDATASAAAPSASDVPPETAELALRYVVASRGSSGTVVTPIAGGGVPSAGSNSDAPACGGHTSTPVSGTIIPFHATSPPNDAVPIAIVRSRPTKIAARALGVRSSAPLRTTMLSGWFVAPMSK